MCLVVLQSVCVCVCVCVWSLTCHTRGSSCSVEEERHTLRVRVCEEQVMTLAMIAPLMEKGSMVYTTNTMNRKKDTYAAGNRKSNHVTCSPLRPVTGLCIFL